MECGNDRGICMSMNIFNLKVGFFFEKSVICLIFIIEIKIDF